MQRLLTDSNIDLLNQSHLLINLIDAGTSSPLLALYKLRIRELCVQMASDAQRNLDDLSHGLTSTFEAILSNTQAVASYVDIIGSRFTAPILRARADDDLMLAVLRWLHGTHPKTKDHPFAAGDGGFSVYHDPKFPTIYFIPASRQHTLLYVPLFFHEFGHVLYRFHKPEMDDLVRDFQQTVASHATPTTIRDRRSGSSDNDFRTKLVLAWYPWTQEFFCDAVGLTIGGPSYLKAFSHYLRLRSSEQYYRSQRLQLESRHPVTILRTRMLADRARSIGLGQLAESVESDWSACARLMNVPEDFEGTWSEDLMIPLRRTLDNMLEEAAPRLWNVDPSAETPIEIVDRAWTEFDRFPKGFGAWEAEEMRTLRGSIKSGLVFGEKA